MEHLGSVVALSREDGIAVTFMAVGSAMKEDDQELRQAVLNAGCEISG